MKRRSIADAASWEQVVGCGAGFLPSPLLNGGSGNGKIVHQEQSGDPTRNHEAASSCAVWPR